MQKWRGVGNRDGSLRRDVSVSVVVVALTTGQLICDWSHVEHSDQPNDSWQAADAAAVQQQQASASQQQQQQRRRRRRGDGADRRHITRTGAAVVKLHATNRSLDRPACPPHSVVPDRHRAGGRLDEIGSIVRRTDGRTDGRVRRPQPTDR